LDKCLYVGIPTPEEIADILIVQSRNINLAQDVVLEEVAKWCQNFTGADTQALLYNAQLESIHELVSYEFEKKDNQNTNHEHNISIVSFNSSQYLTQERKSELSKQVYFSPCTR